MQLQDRYHIQLNNRRTTITLDTVLSELLAIKLGYSPDDKRAHSAVRDWLEPMIIENMGGNLPTNSRVSQWTRRYAIEAIANPKLISQVIDWRIG